VLDLEDRLPKPSYTVNLLRVLHLLRPGIKPVWIAGSDVRHDIDRWHEPEEVTRLARFVVLPRNGVEPPGSASSVAASRLVSSSLQVALPRVSSTEVREKLRAGDDVRGLVDHEVTAYIERRGLYR
jgi:nicotinate-nucleotide adenylyltransferase